MAARTADLETAALEPRLKAVVSVGWMTTGDTQQAYNVSGAIGTFALLPGVWNRLDIPDLIAMAAPMACMVVSLANDRLFPPLGQNEAARQMADAFAWAGVPNRFRCCHPSRIVTTRKSRSRRWRGSISTSNPHGISGETIKVLAGEWTVSL